MFGDAQTTHDFLTSVDCRWSSYGVWSECTKTCGGGTRESVRRIEQEAANGGVPCVGEAKRTMECNTEACPGEKIILS